MSESDLRYYKVLYGYYTDDWDWAYGTFSNNHYVLDEDYISDGCSCTESSKASVSGGIKFLYPFHIKKVYFIEGTIKGHITLTCSSATSTVTAYRVTVCSINEDTTDTELYTSGWVTVNDSLDWDSTYGVGEEKVYPFWIDAWEKSKLSEKDRIYVKVEVNADMWCYLLHTNDSTWEDLKIEIPIVM